MLNASLKTLRLELVEHVLDCDLRMLLLKILIIDVLDNNI